MPVNMNDSPVTALALVSSRSARPAEYANTPLTGIKKSAKSIFSCRADLPPWLLPSM